MHTALIAAVCCALTGAQPPFAQNWTDTGLITVDDDWSGVPAVVGYRGDGLVAEPGVDPRTVVADGSATPVDVTANRTDPGAIGLASGVAEFELPNPVVAIQGSATAAAPHLVVALDTRGRAGISVRLLLRDIDPSEADAVEPVAVQYRIGASGEFANAPGGYVADVTTGAGQAAASTQVSTTLPAAADGQPLVELRVITTNAAGRDEWVGVDDIEVTAATVIPPGDCGGGDPPPAPGPAPPPAPAPSPVPQPEDPRQARPELTDLELEPETFAAARRGPAIVRRGRAGAALRFRLSKPAMVRLAVRPGGARTRFQVHGRRGLNRMRFTGRIRGRALAEGAYTLVAVATDRAGRSSAPVSIGFRIGRREGEPSREEG